jgi:predicted lipoprotein
MRALLLCLTTAFATPAWTDIAEVVNVHLRPSLAGFSARTAELESAAQGSCNPALLTPAFNAAFDAWMPLADVRLGPSEQAALSIAFWPDSRGFIEKALRQILSANDPVAEDPTAYAHVSIAARGLFALERMLFDPAFAPRPDAPLNCTLVQTIAADLAAQAAALETAWDAGFAETLLTAGANSTFQTPLEARRAIYTQILAGLEFTEATRIGRPLGEPLKPRPKRAEAWRSGRPLRNITLACGTALRLAHALGDDLPLPKSDAALARVLEQASTITDPSFQDIDGPIARFRLEVLQQSVVSLKTALSEELGPPLSLTVGFNSQDGD